MELVVVSMGTVLLALILISIFIFIIFFFLVYCVVFLCIAVERLRSGGGGTYQVWGEQWMGSLGI